MTNHQPDTPAEILDKYWINRNNGYPKDSADERALEALLQLALEAVGRDELSHARLDKLKQSPPHQRNQVRHTIREALVTAFKTVAADSEKCNTDPEKSSDATVTNSKKSHE